MLRFLLLLLALILMLFAAAQAHLTLFHRPWSLFDLSLAAVIASAMAIDTVIKSRGKQTSNPK
jgi:hypothetical protein